MRWMIAPLWTAAAFGEEPVMKDLYPAGGGHFTVAVSTCRDRSALLNGTLANHTDDTWLYIEIQVKLIKASATTCRAMKVDKEEVMGCLAAVEAWMKMDLAALNRSWEQRVIAALVETVSGVLHAHPDSRRGQPLSDPYCRVGPGSLEVYCCRLRPPVARRRAANRSPHRVQSESRSGGARPRSEGATHKPPANHLHDDAAGRGTDRRPAPARDPECGAKKRPGVNRYARRTLVTDRILRVGPTEI